MEEVDRLYPPLVLPESTPIRLDNPSPASAPAPAPASAPAPAPAPASAPTCRPTGLTMRSGQETLQSESSSDSEADIFEVLDLPRYVPRPMKKSRLGAFIDRQRWAEEAAARSREAEAAQVQHKGEEVVTEAVDSCPAIAVVPVLAAAPSDPRSAIAESSASSAVELEQSGEEEEKREDVAETTETADLAAAHREVLDRADSEEKTGVDAAQREVLDGQHSTEQAGPDADLSEQVLDSQDGEAETGVGADQEVVLDSQHSDKESGLGAAPESMLDSQDSNISSIGPDAVLSEQELHSQDNAPITVGEPSQQQEEMETIPEPATDAALPVEPAAAVQRKVSKSVSWSLPVESEASMPSSQSIMSTMALGDDNLSEPTEAVDVDTEATIVDTEMMDVGEDPIKPFAVEAPLMPQASFQQPAESHNVVQPVPESDYVYVNEDSSLAGFEAPGFNTAEVPSPAPQQPEFLYAGQGNTSMFISGAASSGGQQIQDLSVVSTDLGDLPDNYTHSQNASTGDEMLDQMLDDINNEDLSGENVTMTDEGLDLEYGREPIADGDNMVPSSANEMADATQAAEPSTVTAESIDEEAMDSDDVQSQAAVPAVAPQPALAAQPPVAAQPSATAQPSTSQDDDEMDTTIAPETGKRVANQDPVTNLFNLDPNLQRVSHKRVVRNSDIPAEQAQRIKKLQVDGSHDLCYPNEADRPLERLRDPVQAQQLMIRWLKLNLQEVWDVLKSPEFAFENPDQFSGLLFKQMTHRLQQIREVLGCGITQAPSPWKSSLGMTEYEGWQHTLREAVKNTGLLALPVQPDDETLDIRRVPGCNMLYEFQMQCGQISSESEAAKEAESAARELKDVLLPEIRPAIVRTARTNVAPAPSTPKPRATPAIGRGPARKFPADMAARVAKRDAEEKARKAQTAANLGL